MADVGFRKVGIVMGYEVSRLSRNCADWHQLLELCGVFDTLIADTDGVYQPRDFNDRLLLGLKGTMSEAERHSIRLRLDAGRISKFDFCSLCGDGDRVFQELFEFSGPWSAYV